MDSAQLQQLADFREPNRKPGEREQLREAQRTYERHTKRRCGDVRRTRTSRYPSATLSRTDAGCLSSLTMTDKEIAHGRGKKTV
jgi:hypothetical protein